MKKTSFIASIALAALFAVPFIAVGPGTVTAATALDNGVAATPIMGWNSWNEFGGTVTDADIRAQADALSDTNGGTRPSLASRGYNYVILDAGWYTGSRNADGSLHVNSASFPYGIKALADYVHSKGLKFGIYLWQDSIGHETADAKQIAGYGVDYLKYDCYNTPKSDPTFTAMRDALAATHRDIAYMVHYWDETNPESDVSAVANSWRQSNDVQNAYAQPSVERWASSTLGSIEQAAHSSYLSAPGGYNDMDMLYAGMGGQTFDELKTQYTMEAVMPSSLILSDDLSTIDSDPATLAMISNPEVIAVNQDAAGKPAYRVKDYGSTEVWAKELGTSKNTKAVVLMNENSSSSSVTVNWADIGLPSTASASVRDLWQQSDQGNFVGSYTATVPAHGVVMLKISGSGGSTVVDPVGVGFSEDFTSSIPANWTAVNGMWTDSAGKAHGTSHSNTDSFLLRDSTAKDFSYEGDITVGSSKGAGALVFRSNSTASEAYVVSLDAQHDTLQLSTRPSSLLGTYAMPISARTTYHVKVLAVGSNIKVFVNGGTTPVIDVNDSTYSSGRFGIDTSSGTADFDNLLVKPVLSDNFNSGAISPSWNAVGGIWTNPGSYVQGTSPSGTDTYLMRDERGSDFTYEADVTVTSANGAGALVFRTNSTGVYGYTVTLDEQADQVKLFHSFPYSPLATYDTTIAVGTTYHLKVVTAGTSIKVYFNGGATPVIDLVNPDYSTGQFGLDVYSGTARFDNVQVH
jgi:alpha-galactosidase